LDQWSKFRVAPDSVKQDSCGSLWSGWSRKGYSKFWKQIIELGKKKREEKQKQKQKRNKAKQNKRKPHYQRVFPGFAFRCTKHSLVLITSYELEIFVTLYKM